MSLFRRLSLAAATLLSLASTSRGAVPALATALDTPVLAWNTGGDSSWTDQTTVTHDGVDAATATGLAAFDSSAWIETTVTAPGFLSWRWRLDLPDGGGSIMELLAGDEPIALASLTTATGWTAASVAVPGSGSVALRWRLIRVSPSDEPSADAAYLDTVAYAPFGPPSLQPHTGLAARSFTAHWNSVAQATSYDVELSTSADFTGSTFVASVSAPATSVAVDGLEPATTYHYRLVAHGPDSISAVSAPLSLTTPAVIRPANDAFASATALAGVSGSAAATTLEATTEIGESFLHQGSVWFKWTAPGPGLWRFQSASASDAPAPSLHVYLGSALPDLEFAATGTNDDSGETVVAELEAVAGATYRIALDADFINQGSATLTWTRLASYSPPANDAFATPAVLSGTSGSVDTTNLHATVEPGETGSAAHSVWFSWKAPASGIWTLETTGSAIPAALSVWSGSTLSGLSLLDSDSASAPSVSRVSIPVTKDLTYRVSLDGQNAAEGALRLIWSLAVPSVVQTIAPPGLTDLPIDAPPFLLEAFASSGLPVAYVRLSGPAALDGELVTLTGQPGTVKLRALQAGDGTYLPAQADFEFVVRTPPANDRIAGAFALPGNTGTLDADLRFATADDTDPAPAHRSIWFRWTATATGILILDTGDSATPVTLAVFTGPADDPTAVASDTRPDAYARLEVPVEAGVGYLLALDTFEEPSPPTRLAWSFAPPSIDQTITFSPPDDVGISAPPVLLEAVASSGLPVRFTLVSGPATLDGDLLTLSGQPGTIIVRASQAGDAYHKPAPDVRGSFDVRPPPANDKIAAAIPISGESGSATGSNLDASADPSDPFPADRSVWWRWIAPYTGVWTVDTTGSAAPASLYVLGGTAIDSLDILAFDSSTDDAALVSLPVEKGATYWIALDTLPELHGALAFSWSLAPPTEEQTIAFPAPPDVGTASPPILLEASASSGLPVRLTLVSGPATLDGELLTLTGKPGAVTLRATQPGDAYYKPAPDVVVTFDVRSPPKNDNIAAAFLLSTAISGTVTGSNVNATAEPVDPAPANRSVWWRWNAPATGVWTVDTTGSDISVSVSVLGGPDVDSLDVLASDAPLDGAGRVSVPVAKGATYWVALDSLDEPRGALKLSWSLAYPALDQTIEFPELPDIVLGDAAPEPVPYASSGLPVTLLVVSGPARIADGLLVLTGQPGTVTLRATQPGDAYYKPAAHVTRAFDVAPLPPLTITLSDLHQTYDGSPHTVSADVTPAPRLRELFITYNGSADAPVNAGTYAVVATADDTRVTGRLVIAKAPLVVTADNQYKLAGAPVPPLTVSYAGFVTGDDTFSLSRIPVATTAARAASPGGSYTIKVSGGASANYSLAYVPGILLVDTFAARREALLLDESGLPRGKLELTIASSGKTFTGKLDLSGESIPRAFKGSLDLDSGAARASASLPVIGAAGTYILALDLGLDGSFSAALTLNGTAFATANEGPRVFVPPAKTKLTWAGAHTAILAPASADSASAPAGSGHATAKIDAAGRLKLSGRLADAAPLTATLAPDASGAYRLFARPYAKRIGSFLAGIIPLVDHPDTARFPGRRYLPVSSAVGLTWIKAAATSDKSYRAGFGPLETTITVDPWSRPLANVELALDFLPDDLDFGARAPELPRLGVLTPAGRFSVTAPGTPPTNLTRFSLKLAPATGSFTGSFVLSDQVKPPPARPETRTVAFSGVLRVPPETETASGTLLGAGHFMLPPLSSAGSTERVAGEIRLEKP